jgi:UDP-glucose 4-epimerase
VALRLTNTYGPRMRIKDARQTFVGVWLRAVLEGRPIEVWEGAQQRDLTYADDAARAFLLAGAVNEAKGGIFNIGGERTTLEALAQALIAANGGSGRYETHAFPAERKRIDIGDYYADDARFRALTGWQPETTLADGLKRSLAYFRAHLGQYV